MLTRKFQVMLTAELIQLVRPIDCIVAIHATQSLPSLPPQFTWQQSSSMSPGNATWGAWGHSFIGPMAQ